MLKAVGISCLIVGFCGLSIEVVREENAKIKVLREIRNFAGYLLKEIEYSHIPIPDICREYLNRSEGKFKVFLDAICLQFEKDDGKSFDVIWDEETNQYPGRNEEKMQLEKMGQCFGFCNVGMQLSAIEQFLRDIEAIIIHKEKKFQDNRKLILYLGVMSGLLLSIILL